MVLALAANLRIPAHLSLFHMIFGSKGSLIAF